MGNKHPRLLLVDCKRNLQGEKGLTAGSEGIHSCPKLQGTREVLPVAYSCSIFLFKGGSLDGSLRMVRAWKNLGSLAFGFPFNQPKTGWKPIPQPFSTAPIPDLTNRRVASRGFGLGSVRRCFLFGRHYNVWHCGCHFIEHRPPPPKRGSNVVLKQNMWCLNHPREIPGPWQTHTHTTAAGWIQSVKRLEVNTTDHSSSLDFWIH